MTVNAMALAFAHGRTEQQLNKVRLIIAFRILLHVFFCSNGWIYYSHLLFFFVSFFFFCCLLSFL
jgi:hypothetical protein